MDIILKDIPDECAADVKYMAMVAVERHLRKGLIIDRNAQDIYNNAINAIKTSNGIE